MTPLRAQRERRGWTKTQLDVRLRAAAKARGETLPQPASVARQIARWENDHGAVSPLYQQLFCDVYGCTPAELGFIEAEEPPEREPFEDLAVEFARASSVDAGVVELLQAQTNAIRQLDALQGAQLIREQMLAHIAHIEELHRHAVRPGVRRMLAKVLADTSPWPAGKPSTSPLHASPGNTSNAPNPQPEKPKMPRFWPSPPLNRHTYCST